MPSSVERRKKRQWVSVSMTAGSSAGFARSALAYGVCGAGAGGRVGECVQENHECIMNVRLFMHYSGKKAGLSSNENTLENNFGLSEAR